MRIMRLLLLGYRSGKCLYGAFDDIFGYSVTDERTAPHFHGRGDTGCDLIIADDRANLVSERADTRSGMCGVTMRPLVTVSDTWRVTCSIGWFTSGLLVG
jgi:hypothetical protein